MKRINNLYNKICDINVIMDMYDNAIRKTTKNKNKLQKFENFYSCKKKFKVKMNKKNKELLNNEIMFEEYRSVRNSYRGHLSYGNCNGLYRKYVINKDN